MTHPSFTCRHCSRTTHNPHDVQERYCGWCHHYCNDYDSWLSDEEQLENWIKRYVAARTMITVRCPLLEASDD